MGSAIFKLLILCFIFISISIYACAKYPKYTPSQQSNFNPKLTGLTINKSYNEVWSALIEYLASSPFIIETFDKQSGLITLHFGPGKITEFVDCGYLETIVVNYKGSFIEGIETYGEADLDGSMNIFVKPLSAIVTHVKLNTHYTFEARDPKTRQIWSFDTGGSDAKKYSAIQEDVVCIPTHKAERMILEIIDKIAGGD